MITIITITVVAVRAPADRTVRIAAPIQPITSNASNPQPRQITTMSATCWPCRRIHRTRLRMRYLIDRRTRRAVLLARPRRVFGRFENMICKFVGAYLYVIC